MTSTTETINLTKEQLEETRKKIIAEYKPAQKMVQVDISIPWESSLVLPYSEAMQFMAALESAELITNRTYGNNKVKTFPMNKGAITIGLIDKQTYTNTKVAELLGLTHDQLFKLNAGEDLINDD